MKISLTEHEIKQAEENHLNISAEHSHLPNKLNGLVAC